MTGRKNNSIRLVHGGQKGQALVVAVITMFLLLFIGGLFVALVAHNLQNAGKSQQGESAMRYALAGIQYASYNLLHSPDGADWRPPLPDRSELQPNDPDLIYLNSTDPEGRYARIDLGGGRALIRVSYFSDPNSGNTQRYIRIESIGRVGYFNPNDPTTFTASPPRLRRKVVAYMAIGLPDYLRFITNINNDTKEEADIGAPPTGVLYPEQMGGVSVRTPGGTFIQTGAPIFANCDLKLMGNLTLQEFGAQNNAVMAAGNISIASETLNGNTYDPTLNGNAIAPSLIPNPNGNGMVPNPQFNTFGGLIRDASPNPDASGYPRGITRLDPPRIDSVDPNSGANRYYSLTRDSGSNLPNTGSLSGNYCLGNGIYINDFNDYEQETTNVYGGQTLPSLWLNHNNPHWVGPYYDPKCGVIVRLGYFGNPAEPGIQMTRTDANFPDPPGNNDATNPPSKQETFYFFYYKPADNSVPVLKLDNPFYRAYLKAQMGNNATDAEVDAWLPPFNGVILAEGDIRIAGIAPAKANIPVRGPGNGDMALAQPPALTFVSNANIYIEGSLIREAPDSMIALLAKNYVAVNTTVFLQPTTPPNFVDTTGNPSDPFDMDIPIGQRYTLAFMFGDNASQYTTNGSASPIYLLLRQGSPQNNPPPGATYMNMFINQWMEANPGDSLYHFAPNSTTWVIQNTLQQDLFEHRSFQLEPAPNNSNYTLSSLPGDVNQLSLGPDPTQYGPPPPQDYLFSQAAVEPMDVRIEALIYAQNGSFFIIPGYPMNMNPNDTPENYAATGSRPEGTDPMYPFYYQPVDCRITIDGAVAENRTATIADQSAWMQLWGYIPRQDGSSNVTVPDAHVKGTDVGFNGGVDEGMSNVQGLRFLYDPVLWNPFLPGTNTPVRQDIWGRVLPPVPKLPVCPQIIYTNMATSG